MHRTTVMKAFALGAAGVGVTAMSLFPGTSECTDNRLVATEMASNTGRRSARSKDELQLVQVVFR